MAVTALSVAACTSSDAAAPSPIATGELGAPPTAEAVDGTVIASNDRNGPTYQLITLGDSYTFGSGTEAPKAESWPAQLAAALSQRAGMNVRVLNLAQERSPSVQVLEEQTDRVGEYKPDVVTLQVGLNDIIGDDPASYDSNIGAIFDKLLQIVPHDRIFAITTPDHTLTVWGRAYGSHADVEAINDSLRAEAQARGIAVIDIGPVNERGAFDQSLLVQEAYPPVPYPTAKQYAAWAEMIGPYVYHALLTARP
jgi:lysophospholipase L1-like esterase